MTLRRVLITGVAGGFGRALVRLLNERRPEVEIIGVDCNDPSDVRCDFVRADVRSSQVARLIQESAVDAVVHFAFVLGPLRDERHMFDVNVHGSRNVLQATAAAGVPRVLAASSVTAYGARADNPPWLTERCPLRAPTDYSYAAHKLLLEKELSDLASARQDLNVAWMRPGVTLGPDLDNYLTRFYSARPFMPLVDGADLPMQFVHVRDVARASLAILESNARGPFNVAPDDTICLSEIARRAGGYSVTIPYRLLKVLGTVGWKLGLEAVEVPPAGLVYQRYPWLMRSERLIDELQFQFEFSSAETLASIHAQAHP